MTQTKLPLFTYQAHAADIMAQRDRYGLHDEMGIGKTATTIGAINRAGLRRGMIVCPAMLRQNWINEFAKFSTYDLRLCKGQNIHDFVAWSRGRFDVLITSYELATKWRKEFARQGEYLDFLAFDEAHYMKNSGANRTKELLGEEANGSNCLVEWAVQSWHITGTPMANDPLDIYTFLRFAKALDLSQFEFVKTFYIRHQGTYGARHYVKPDMVQTLQQLIENNAIRRTHGQIGMYLPPIWMREVLVEGDAREVIELVSKSPGLESAIMWALEAGDLAGIDAEYISTLRRLIGKAKAIPYAQMLREELESGAGKRVVFGIHTEPIQYIKNYLSKHGYKAVAVHGATSELDRQQAVHDFMNDPECMVFIGNIKVAGVGLTLTESSDIDMFESDWTPAGNAQAIKRVHRYGQTKNVTARFITLAGSIDETVNQVVAGKTAAIAQIEGHAMTAAPLLTA